MPEFDSTTRYADITGFPGYKVGTDGSVWSCWIRRVLGHKKGTVSEMTPNWHQLRPVRHFDHRCFITLLPGRITKSIHRLVLETFVGPCPKGMECCHADSDPTNNSLSNLRWDTHAGNMADLPATERFRGSRAKVTAEQVLAMRAAYSQDRTVATIWRLAIQHGIKPMAVRRAVTGKTWKHL